MRDRPILFSAPMVRAIREGRKAQTRRVVKPQPVADRAYRSGYYVHKPGDPKQRRVSTDAPAACLAELCPYGAPGDHLWVRETWADANSEDGPCVLYRADHDRRYLVDESYPVDYANYPGANFAQWAADVESGAEGRWRPSIHMPRWASRITLEVTHVHVERLQDISADDAEAEGSHDYWGKETPWKDHVAPVPVHGFAALWESVNGAGAWAKNPWVWVVSFKRVQP